MSRDAGMYLEDILRSCEKILEYVKGSSFVTHERMMQS